MQVLPLVRSWREEEAEEGEERFLAHSQQVAAFGIGTMALRMRGLMASGLRGAWRSCSRHPGGPAERAAHGNTSRLFAINLPYSAISMRI
mmetsp:Transcript_113186/g.283328  ORF Transcript_113186/g.283328 Transcript_113186/m.283328 type:complete len:90 (+) Transcript_113186:1137-1406(+)